ncbi:MAG: CDP-2,3-bis-(O-geranylgeranyl)-sn-glycerol synthase [Euryarchaeota archaeon]|nr:CDP-2,3-bis-(O-geranylgeranyl)-sn-glycerol synthase [Euryarchaeota archaeon]
MDLMNVIVLILAGFWLMLPAYLPNSAAVLFGGGTPIDFEKSWKGHRLLGDGKTWTGLIGGIAAGTALGFVQIFIALPFDDQNFWGFGVVPRAMEIVLVLAIGSLLGDLAGAFIKRRLGLERGAKAPVLDQYNFIAGAVLLSLLVFPDWFIGAFIEGEHLISLLAVLMITPLLHRGVNIIGYKKGLKKVPW